MSHTKEPWHVANGNQIRSERDQIARAWMMRGGEGKENARRIVACVNACAGISSDDLERYYNTGGGIDEAMEEASLRDHVRAIQQRDALQPQAEALHKVAAAMGFEAGDDVTLAHIAVKALKWRADCLEDANQNVLAERDDWRTYAIEAEAQRVQVTAENKELRAQIKALQKDVLAEHSLSFRAQLHEAEKQRDELLAALKWAKAALDRASAGSICQRDLEDAYDIAKQAIASVKGGAA